MEPYFKKIIFITYFYFWHPGIFLKNLYLNLKSKKVPSGIRKPDDFVSIIIVTFNALDFVEQCLSSLAKTNYKNREVIVVDNSSDKQTVDYLKMAKKKKLIDRLYLSKTNTYFSGGNNLGASISSKRSGVLVFLNSDVEIRNPEWLKILLSQKPKSGIVSFGKVDIPVIRPDGWCFMVDRKIFERLGGLSEYYKMNWAITEFTGRAIQMGFEVRTITNPDNYVYHFGQKSRPKKTKLNFEEMSVTQVLDIFQNKKVELLKV